MLESLPPSAPDTLMEMIRRFREDSRAHKIDLGIGTYRDSRGFTPVMTSVKAAEGHLLQTQASKSYLGPAGDRLFLGCLRELVLPEDLRRSEHVAAAQTPGGTGAFRLGAELIRSAHPRATVFVGTPTWPNHLPILRALDLSVVTYVHYDRTSGAIPFEAAFAELRSAKEGDILLLHGCCHNPSGADLKLWEWARLAELIRDRGLVPFIDLAYHGMGRSLAEDLEGTHLMMSAAREAVLAVSCSKSFGLYRDRVGALLVTGSDRAHIRDAQSQLEGLARIMWSMPPDHGAAVVRTILASAELNELWRAELRAMRERVNGIRSELRSRIHVDLKFAFASDLMGMFSLLPLSPAQIAELRRTHAIYMADNGRVNIAGLGDDDLDRFSRIVSDII